MSAAVALPSPADRRGFGTAHVGTPRRGSTNACSAHQAPSTSTNCIHVSIAPSPRQRRACSKRAPMPRKIQAQGLRMIGEHVPWRVDCDAYFLTARRDEAVLSFLLEQPQEVP